jgi:xylulokinase
MAFDINKLNWSDEILSSAGVDIKLFSPPVPAGTLAGPLKPEIAERTGLSTELKIVTVSHDQVAAAVGAGAFSSDVAVDGAGSVECITPVYDSLPDLDVMYEGNYAVVPYVIPGKYVCYAFSYAGGALVQWCVDQFAKQETILAKEEGVSVHKYLERKSASPTGLLFLPHITGAATPYMDGGSRGAILGLRIEHGIADIYRASMEGVAYEMALNMRYLKKSGVNFRVLYATGGGAVSREWVQMKADVLDIPIVSLAAAEAGTVGSAMLTGIAIGVYKNLDDAAAFMVEKTETFTPNAEKHGKYMEVYRRYEKLYDAVRPLMG